MTDPHLAVSSGRTFEDLLADPNEQYDARSELLASILVYTSAPPASAGSKPWQPTRSSAGRYAWLYPSSSTTGAAAA